MNPEDQNIDRMFEDRLGNQEFPYDASEWAKMEQMLDAEDAKAGAYWFNRRNTLIALLAIVGSGAFWWAWLSNSDIPVDVATASVAFESPAVQETPKSVITENKLTEVKQESNSVNQVSHNNYQESAKTEDDLINNTFQAPSTLPVAQNKTPHVSEIKKISSLPIMHLDSRMNAGAHQQPLLMEFTNFSLPVIETEAASPEVVASAEATDTTATKPSFIKRFSGQLVGGGNYFNSLSNTPDNPTDYHFDLFGGVGYSFEISRKWQLSSEFLYMRRDGNELTRSSQSVRYFLTKEESTQTISTRSMDWFHVPMSVKYRLNHHHGLTAGVWGSWLVNTTSRERTTTRTTVYKGTSQVHTKEEEEKGYVEGFNRLNTGVSLGYEYSRNIMSVGLRYNYGFTDLTLDQDFVPPARDNISEFQLYLKLSILK